MCVVSMVYDHFGKEFDKYRQAPSWPPYQPPPAPAFDVATIEALRTLIKEFREAIDAAKKVDRLTAQPDCEDPEKAKLVARVAELEAQLAAPKAKKRKAVQP